MSAFALLIPPVNFTVYLHRLTERSPTQQYITNIAAAASVYDFSPVTFSAQADSTSELLRFL